MAKYIDGNFNDFSRMFIVEGENHGGMLTMSYTDDDGHVRFRPSYSKTGFIISVKDGELRITKKFGRDPNVEEVNTAFGRFVKEYEAEHGKITVFERKNRYRFCYRQGMSGAQDTYIEIDLGDGYPNRRKITHESCYGKVNESVRCFVYDFLDLCVAGNFFRIEDGCYCYDEEEDSNSDCEMQIIKPRLLYREEGWTDPGRASSGVVRLGICHEEPEEEGDD